VENVSSRVIGRFSRRTLLHGIGYLVGFLVNFGYKRSGNPAATISATHKILYTPKPFTASKIQIIDTRKTSECQIPNLTISTSEISITLQIYMIVMNIKNRL
jgi:hypothetical protein